MKTRDGVEYVPGMNLYSCINSFGDYKIKTIQTAATDSDVYFLDGGPCNPALYYSSPKESIRVLVEHLFDKILLLQAQVYNAICLYNGVDDSAT